VRWKYWRNRCARHCSHSTRQCLPPPLFVTQKGCRSEFQNPPIKSFTSKSKFFLALNFRLAVVTTGTVCVQTLTNLGSGDKCDVHLTPIRTDVVGGRPGCRVRDVGAPTRECTVADVSGRKPNEKAGSQV
jgi:hypothetical protein